MKNHIQISFDILLTSQCGRFVFTSKQVNHPVGMLQITFDILFTLYLCIFAMLLCRVRQ